MGTIDSRDLFPPEPVCQLLLAFSPPCWDGGPGTCILHNHFILLVARDYWIQLLVTAGTLSTSKLLMLNILSFFARSSRRTGGPALDSANGFYWDKR
jgi:hypothetical protein